MKVLFVSSIAPIVRDRDRSTLFWRDTLGLPIEPAAADDDYQSTEKLDGVKHFGLWPLAQAAQACFGTDTWPEDVPVPQGSVEVDVDDVDRAVAELEAAGCRLLHGARTEPWGQTVARVLSPEGLIVGVGHTPWMREGDT